MITKDNVLAAVTQYEELIAYAAAVHSRLSKLYLKYQLDDPEKYITLDKTDVRVTVYDGDEHRSVEFPLSYLTFSDEELEIAVKAEIDAVHKEIAARRVANIEREQAFKLAQYKRLKAEFEPKLKPKEDYEDDSY